MTLIQVQVQVQHRWVFLGQHEFSRLASPIVTRITKINPPLVSASASASPSSSSSSFSASPYPGQLLDGKTTKRKSERIAGIDQDELLDPTLLADPDSCFCEFGLVRIHHKVYDAKSLAQNPIQIQTVCQLPSDQNNKVGLPIILLHGFGASLFSWNHVLKPLAEVAGSKVLAFDRPAFGLTSRASFFGHSYSSPVTEDSKKSLINPYSTAFSVLVTFYFIDSLAAEKAILVGHSAGSLVAIESYFEAPERVAALILVAPAIFAPRAVHKVVNESQSGRDKKIQSENSKSNIDENPLIRIYKIFVKFCKYIAQAVVRMITGMRDMLKTQYKNALLAVLKSEFAVMLVRMIIGKFGITAIRNAWYDSSKVTDEILNGYTKPLRTKNWDKALVEYTAAMLTDAESESKPPLRKRVHEISCPVLIVTGDSDRIVPSWNAERLSRVIPRCCLEVIKHCGHLPQEERPEEFVTVVEKFLQKFVVNSDEHCQPAVAT